VGRVSLAAVKVAEVIVFLLLGPRVFWRDRGVVKVAGARIKGRGGRYRVELV